MFDISKALQAAKGLDDQLAELIREQRITNALLAAHVTCVLGMMVETGYAVPLDSEEIAAISSIPSLSEMLDA